MDLPVCFSIKRKQDETTSGLRGRHWCSIFFLLFIYFLFSVAHCHVQHSEDKIL